METSTLRWILIILGAIVIASIWLFFNPEKQRRLKASRRSRKDVRKPGKGAARERREPTLESGLTPEPGSSETDWRAAFEDGEPVGQGELDIGGDRAGQAATPSHAPAGPPPDQIVSMFLLARDNHVITGAELLQAAVSTGLDFGEMQIFHRLPEGGDQAVFSMANAEKPGHFERDEWNTFETAGVVLFLTLPGPVQALDAWDSMLAAARRMSEILQADLLDGERNPFTRQREAEIREQMREYDRRQAQGR